MGCWVVVFPLSIVAGFFAVAFEAWATWRTWQSRRSNAVRMHAFAALMWLCGNVTWMISEMLFDPTDRSLKLGFPWYNGPLIHMSSKSDYLAAYGTGISIARCIFAAGAIILFLFYAS